MDANTADDYIAPELVLYQRVYRIPINLGRRQPYQRRVIEYLRDRILGSTIWASDPAIKLSDWRGTRSGGYGYAGAVVIAGLPQLGKTGEQLAIAWLGGFVLDAVPIVFVRNTGGRHDLQQFVKTFEGFNACIDTFLKECTHLTEFKYTPMEAKKYFLHGDWNRPSFSAVKEAVALGEVHVLCALANAKNINKMLGKGNRIAGEVAEIKKAYEEFYASSSHAPESGHDLKARYPVIMIMDESDTYIQSSTLDEGQTERALFSIVEDDACEESSDGAADSSSVDDSVASGVDDDGTAECAVDLSEMSEAWVCRQNQKLDYMLQFFSVTATPAALFALRGKHRIKHFQVASMAIKDDYFGFLDRLPEERRIRHRPVDDAPARALTPAALTDYTGAVLMIDDMVADKERCRMALVHGEVNTIKQQLIAEALLSLYHAFALIVIVYNGKGCDVMLTEPAVSELGERLHELNRSAVRSHVVKLLQPIAEVLTRVQAMLKDTFGIPIVIVSGFMGSRATVFKSKDRKLHLTDQFVILGQWTQQYGIQLVSRICGRYDTENPPVLQFWSTTAEYEEVRRWIHLEQLLIDIVKDARERNLDPLQAIQDYSYPADLVKGGRPMRLANDRVAGHLHGGRMQFYNNAVYTDPGHRKGTMLLNIFLARRLRGETDIYRPHTAASAYPEAMVHGVATTNEIVVASTQQIQDAVSNLCEELGLPSIPLVVATRVERIDIADMRIEGPPSDEDIVEWLEGLHGGAYSVRLDFDEPKTLQWNDCPLPGHLWNKQKESIHHVYPDLVFTYDSTKRQVVVVERIVQFHDIKLDHKTQSLGVVWHKLVRNRATQEVELCIRLDIMGATPSQPSVASSRRVVVEQDLATSGSSRTTAVRGPAVLGYTYTKDDRSINLKFHATGPAVDTEEPVLEVHVAYPESLQPLVKILRELRKRAWPKDINRGLLQSVLGLTISVTHGAAASLTHDRLQCLLSEMLNHLESLVTVEDRSEKSTSIDELKLHAMNFEKVMLEPIDGIEVGVRIPNDADMTLIHPALLDLGVRPGYPVKCKFSVQNFLQETRILLERADNASWRQDFRLEQYRNLIKQLSRLRAGVAMSAAADADTGVSHFTAAGAPASSLDVPCATASNPMLFTPSASTQVSNTSAASSRIRLAAGTPQFSDPDDTTITVREVILRVRLPPNMNYEAAAIMRNEDEIGRLLMPPKAHFALNKFKAKTGIEIDRVGGKPLDTLKRPDARELASLLKDWFAETDASSAAGVDSDAAPATCGVVRRRRDMS